MDNQMLLNAIATLTQTVGTLLAINEKDSAKIVVDKIIELVEKLNVG